MTMNTRQAGAFTELIKKEEQARERWNATHGQQFKVAAAAGEGLNGSQTVRANGFGSTQQQREAFARSQPAAGSTSARPSSARSSRPEPAARTSRLATGPVSTATLAPSSTARIVDVLVPRSVESTRLEPYEAYTEREEAYEEEVVVPSVRRREVLVKQWVDEPYERREVVQRVRTVKVPTTKFREVPVWATVDVPEQRVEIEEPAEAAGAQSFRSSGSQSFRGGQSARPTSASLPRGSAAPANGFAASQRFEPLPSAAGAARLGFKVRSASNAPGTVQVFEVEPNQLASRSGLKQGDVVLSANGRQTNDMLSFKNAVQASKGPLLLQVRRGVERFVITLQR